MRTAVWEKKFDGGTFENILLNCSVTPVGISFGRI